LAVFAIATGAHAQTGADPLDRYQREPMPQTGDDPAIQEIDPDDGDPPPTAKPDVVIEAAPAVRVPDFNRPAHPGKGPTLPDDYLDPSWPVDGSETRIAPEQSDNVEEVPLEDDQLDTAEKEEAEHYKEALGLYKDPDELTEDNWGDDPGSRTHERDIEEYEDPAEW
jgi:hypothetical protein